MTAWIALLLTTLLAGPALAADLDGTLKKIKSTGTITLGYRDSSRPFSFEGPDGSLADPDLEVRVYHDARLAEASHCGRWIRHPGLQSIRNGLGVTLGERWLRNMLLNKWLEYCSDRGHRFAAVAGVPGRAAHEPV